MCSYNLTSDSNYTEGDAIVLSNVKTTNTRIELFYGPNLTHIKMGIKLNDYSTYMFNASYHIFMTVSARNDQQDSDEKPLY